MMTETLIRFSLDAYASLSDAVTALFWPMVFFLLLGLAVKRLALFGDMQQAFSETSLNLKIIAFNVLLMTPVFGLVAQGLSDFIVSRGLIVLDHDTWMALPPVVVIVIAVFVGDFTGYWRHRLEHTRALWPAHAVHHSDTAMTWLTLERFHPLNRLSTMMIDSAVLLMLGFPPYAVIANNLIRHYYGFLIHADLPWTYGKMDRLFVSPAMHRWHHAADARFYNANFATVFSVFDRLFGTYRVPGPCKAPLGVSDNMGGTLIAQLAYAFQPRAYKR